MCVQNVVLAGKRLSDDALGCLLHLVHLVWKLALDQCEEYKVAIQKLHDFATKLSHSPQATGTFLQKQVDLGKNEANRLPAPSALRWWTNLPTCNKGLARRDELNVTAVAHPKLFQPDPKDKFKWIITDIDASNLTDITADMITIKKLFGPLEADSHPTINLVLPAYAALLRTFREGIGMPRERFGRVFAENFKTRMEDEKRVRIASVVSCLTVLLWSDYTTLDRTDQARPTLPPLS